ncbi:hypothetical protein LMIY3S_05904 [Labrys miyagiensis]
MRAIVAPDLEIFPRPQASRLPSYRICLPKIRTGPDACGPGNGPPASTIAEILP